MAKRIILSTNSLKKGMESSVENLNVDIWAYKVEAEDNTTSIASSGRLIVTNTISLKTKKAKIANMFNYRQTLLIRSLGGGGGGIEIVHINWVYFGEKVRPFFPYGHMQQPVRNNKLSVLSRCS